MNQETPAGAREVGAAAGTPVGRFEWERALKTAPVGRTARAIGLLLATFASPDGGDVRPGNDRLIEESGWSRPTVKRALAELRAAGYLQRAESRHASARRGLAAEYLLVLPADELELGLPCPVEKPGDKSQHGSSVSHVHGSSSDRHGSPVSPDMAHPRPPTIHDQPSTPPNAREHALATRLDCSLDEARAVVTQVARPDTRDPLSYAASLSDGTLRTRLGTVRASARKAEAFDAQLASAETAVAALDVDLAARARARAMSALGMTAAPGSRQERLRLAREVLGLAADMRATA